MITDINMSTTNLVSWGSEMDLELEDNYIKESEHVEQETQEIQEVSDYGQQVSQREDDNILTIEKTDENAGTDEHSSPNSDTTTNVGRRHISNKFYFLMVMTDITTSLSTAPFGVSRLSKNKAALYSSVIICNISGVLFSFGSQLSVLFVALQSIVRTHSLLMPLRRVRMLPLKIFIGCYLLFQCSVAMFPFFFGKSYKYYERVSCCNFSLREVVDPAVDKLLYNTMLWFLAMLPFLWPVIPILLSCFISVCLLAVRKHEFIDVTRSARCRHASITIVLVTVVYIVLNVPYWIYLMSFLVDFSAAVQWWSKHDPNFYLYASLNPYSIMLNAAINPIIYLARMRTVRRDFRNIVTCSQRGVIEMTLLRDRSEVVIQPDSSCQLTPQPSQFSLRSFSTKNSTQKGRSVTQAASLSHLSEGSHLGGTAETLQSHSWQPKCSDSSVLSQN